MHLGRRVSKMPMSVQSINFFASFVLQAMIKSKWRTTFLIAPTVLHVWLISFLGLSAQAVVFLRLRPVSRTALIFAPFGSAVDL